MWVFEMADIIKEEINQAREELEENPNSKTAKEKYDKAMDRLYYLFINA